MRKPLSLLLPIALMGAIESPSRLREGLGEGMSAATHEQALPQPLPQAGGEQLAVMRVLVQQDQAVAAVSYRLVTANAQLCPDKMIEIGISLGTLAQYDAAYRPAAAKVLGMTDRPTVELVVPGSPADRAGIRPGDVLLAADEAIFVSDPTRSSRGRFTGVEAAMGMLDDSLADGKAVLTINRGVERLQLAVTGVPACRARFQVAGEGLDAFTTASIWIKLPPRMVEFVGPPDQLAAVMAHELAHKALRHQTARGSAVRAQELQADRLAPYLMARASYDPAAAVTLWQRFEAKRLGGLFPGSYPRWSERIAAIERERGRITDLSSRGDTIIPPDDLRAR